MTPRQKPAGRHTRLRVLFSTIVLLTIAQIACDGSGADSDGRAVRETVSGDWIRVYFTSPRYPDHAALHHGGLDEELAAVIAQAQTSVDVAAYDLDLESVADALVAAHQRGVQVRLVTESDNVDEAVAELRRFGVPVVEDESDWSLMHNKFVVIDRQWVWLGSWNLTENDTYRNNNNAVLIASAALAENYSAEFEEMAAGRFGPDSPANTPNPHIIITTTGADGQERRVEIENYFAPEDGVADQVVAEIESAQSRIRFMAFSFTSDAIAQAMIARADAGVVVQGVLEAHNIDVYSEYESLRAAVHDVLLDGNPYFLHHKVIIIDDATVILGSYNFTTNAEEDNDENLLIIHDPEVAALFVEEFGRVYEQARASP